MEEKWKPVVGWESRYEVSDHGRVRSLPHVTPGRPLGDGRFVMMPFKGGIVNGSSTNSGHIDIALNQGPKRYLRPLHILVLEAFVGPRPPGMYGLHWDDDPTNNHISNLRWDTPSANTFDKIRNGRHFSANKTHCPQGHPYDEINTYHHPGGSRRCRECRRQKAAARYQNRNPNVGN